MILETQTKTPSIAPIAKDILQHMLLQQRQVQEIQTVH